MTPALALSVVAPCYNEEAGLALFVERMTRAAEGLYGPDRYELILVDDGSRDRTFSVMQGLMADHPAIVAVRLSRNHGHQTAVSAGLSLARGARILLIDADLQDPPELLPLMVEKLDAGFDVVFGRRRTRAGESPFKLATAGLFYRTLAALSDSEIPLDTGDFRLMSRRIVERLNAMPERDRFIRGMVAWLGGRQTEILYDRDPRAAGETQYTLRRMVRLAADGLTSFSTAPLRLASVLAALGALAGLGLLVYALVGFFSGHATPGWTSLALIIVFFSTAQLLSLAIIGEYLGRTYMQAKGRPLYLIDEVLRAPERPEAGQG
jgi:dolichol-phosphate mannosyltransferase